MTDLNRELDQYAVVDFENTGKQDTSKVSDRPLTRDELTAIAAVAKIRKAK
jgi:hypothetical protein